MTPITATDSQARSLDLTADNLTRLRALFPEAFTEGKVDMAVLGQLLGAAVDESDEKYGLNWHGKRRARQLALTPSAGTLRPAPADSVAWDSTQNLMIEGDNLEVLKLLQKSYAGQVKLIYIDPPYNTGHDFVYPDNFQDSIKNYQQLTGQVEGGQKISSNAETSGRFHTDWLTMMYPRLKLARNLLRDDGVIFVSIDDNEVPHVRVLLSEIFGEENFMGDLIWNLKSGTQAGHFTRSHEYVICYAKQKESLSFFKDRTGGYIRHGALKIISRDNPLSEITFPKGLEFEGNDATFEGEIGGSEKQFIQGKMVFRKGKLAEPVTIGAGWAMKNQVLSWLEGKETFDSKGQRVTKFFFNSSGILWYEKERGTLHPKTVLESEVGNTKGGSTEIFSLLGEKVFDFPKPSSLIKFLVSTSTDIDSQDIILDFFAGSGTTGHAVMAQNAADGGNRRYILVQLPEPLDPTNRDQKTAADFCDQLGKPRTIAELTKERLRRAAAKVAADNPDFSGDLGFRAYRLDSTNIRAWDPNPQDVAGSLFANAEHLKEGRSEADILTELLLKLGLPLTVDVEERQVGTHTLYAVGAGTLLACLSARIERAEVETLAQALVGWQRALAPEGGSQVVLRDSAFRDDVGKANFTAILEQAGVDGRNIRSL